MKKFRYTVRVNQEGKEWSKVIDKVPFTIGREKADVLIPSNVISRQQLRIGRDEHGIWMQDLGSRNGTYLEGKELTAHQKTYYTEGQKIDIGFELGLTIALSAQEIVQHNVVELKQPVVQEVKQVKVVGGPSLPVEEDDFVGDLNQVEKQLFAQIRKMVGNEAEAVRKSSLQKAKEIEDRARAEKDKLLAEARKEAELILKKSHDEVEARIADLNHKKSLLENTVISLSAEESALAAKVTDLERREQTLKRDLSALEETIRSADEKMKQEQVELEALRVKLHEDREKFTGEYEEFRIEERKLRAKLEAEILEARVKALQIQAEATGIQEQIGQLRPQIAELRAEKARWEEETTRHRLRMEEEHKSLSSLLSDQERLRTELAKLDRELEFRKIELQRLEGEKLSRAEELRNLTIKAESDSAALVQKTHAECAELKARSLRELEEIEDKKKDLRKIIEEESVVLKQKHQAEYEQLLKEKNSLTQELRKRRAEAEAQCENILEEAREEGRQLIREAEENSSKLKASAEEFLSELKVRKEALEVELLELGRKRVETLEETRKKSEVLLSEARKNAELIMKDAQENASQVLNRERFIFDEEQRKIRQETEMFIENAHRNAQEILARVEAEARENKLKQQQALAEMKQVELFRIKELKAKGEEEILKRKHEHAKNVSTNVFALVASEMYKAKDKVLDDTLIDEFTRGIKELVVDTMLDRVGPDDDKLQSILKTSADAKSRERIYWKRLQVTAFGCAFALMTLIAFPQIVTYPRNKIVAAFTEKSDNGSEEFLSKVKEARIRAVYNPETTAEFKPSYAENVLFTTDYLVKIQAQAYQDQWILELNDFFIKELDVKDTTIIKFVSLESALLKDLGKLKESADPQNPDPKIKEMNDRESLFRKKLAEIFEDPAKVPRYYEFSEKFWNNYYNPRRPASQN